MSEPNAYSLLELNQYIRRVISLNFDEPLWIECEIGQASLSRGHWYLDLIQKEENNIVAQCQAAMWANVYFFSNVNRLFHRKISLSKVWLSNLKSMLITMNAMV
ncbi:MAG: exodeoxyribonuclease VII large subunit [Saprospiraceae bacterium]|nr:exodeoxyribonuclease VII large subunit [Candidatus Opimibacter iunctus]